MSFGDRLRAREPLVGSWLSFRDPAVAEMSAELGFDFLVLDVEHTPNTLETVIDLVRGADAAEGETATVARLPWNDPVVVKRVLDTGVSGVMAPMVSSAEEARDLVEATRYPPEGMRGVAGSRAARYGLEMEEYFERANEEVAVLAQIETEEGLENVEDIAAVEGIDGLFLGPADLSANLGIYREWESDEFMEAVDRVLAAGEAAETAVSTLAVQEEDVERWMEYGYDFIMAGTDSSHVMAGSQRMKSTFEGAVDRD